MKGHQSEHMKSLGTPWTLTLRIQMILATVSAVGLVIAVCHAGVIEQGFRRFMLAYLVAFAFVLSLSLGALFFVFMQHLTRAGWSVMVRRVAEVLAANMPVLIVLFLPIAFSVARGHGEIYPWATYFSAHGHGSIDHHLLAKRAFLNPSFFLIRWALLLGLWTYLGRFYWKRSVAQDRTRDGNLTLSMERFAGITALLFGVTITLGAFDLLMSLNPLWYSTMFGVYFFAGSVVSSLSVMILLVICLQRIGAITHAIGESHFLDLGRLLFGFVFFWGYIAFSQYMLLWYANIPEELQWLRIRGATTVSSDLNAWTCVLLILLFGNFLIPFAGLMSRHVKRRPVAMAAAAVWLLLMHYLDLNWIVMPEFSAKVSLGGIEIGLLAAVTSLYLLMALRLLSKNSLIPLGDPRLPESALHETVY